MLILDSIGQPTVLLLVLIFTGSDLYTAFYRQQSYTTGSCLWHSLPHDVTSASMLTVLEKCLKTLIFPVNSFITVSSCSTVLHTVYVQDNSGIIC